MVKIRKSHVILFLFFVTAIIALSSCTKPECKISSDCPAKTCAISKCESRKCVYTTQPNCCGNQVKESIESGKPGNQCTCPTDYGKCEGKGKVTVGSRTIDSTYVHYYCSVDNQCVLGIEKKDVLPLNYLDAINAGFFKASSVVKYNKPFDVSKDSFEFKVTLDDASKDLLLPIKLTKVKLLYSSESARAELLIAEKDLNNVLNGIGDFAIINVPLTLNYKPQELEELGSIRYSIDYAYTRQVLSSKTINGTSIYNNETKREAFTAPTKPVFFVRSE